jgi:hypothetical protein
MINLGNVESLFIRNLQMQMQQLKELNNKAKTIAQAIGLRVLWESKIYKINQTYFLVTCL